ncbi:MAG: PEGA domain-containing protein [Deltaproteobacteria bacterium]|nr:PEGA domain-containing protein [Deltaproteobacteria bacterium]
MTSALTVERLNLCILTLIIPVCVQAQEMDPARANFAVAIERFAEEDYAGALDAFQASYDQRPKAFVLFNIAMCQKALLRYAESIITFRLFLDDRGDAVKPEKAEAARGAIEELEKIIATVHIESATDGATVAVDGEAKADTPLESPLLLNPGRHKIEVTKEGFASFTTEITIVAGARIEIIARLEPSPARESDAGIELILENTFLVNEPPPVDVLPKKNAKTGLFIAGLATGGLGLVAVGVGSYCAHARQSTDIDAAKRAIERDDTGAYRGVEDTARAHEIGAIVSFSVAGALISSGAIMVLLGRNETEGEKARVSPTSSGMVIRF